MTDTPIHAKLRAAVHDVLDFPRPGVAFKDISPLLGDGALFDEAIAAMAAPFEDRGVTHIAAIESRGFLLGGAIAARLHAGVIPLRKVGKLPRATVRRSYVLEYGTDALEAHTDACNSDAVVLIVDDVLATGGTATAAIELVEALGAEVAGVAVLLEIAALGGRDRLRAHAVTAVLTV